MEGPASKYRKIDQPCQDERHPQTASLSDVQSSSTPSQGVQHPEASGPSSVGHGRAFQEETSVIENSSSAQASHACHLLPVPNDVHVSAIESPVILGPASGTTVNYNNPAHLAKKADQTHQDERHLQTSSLSDVQSSSPPSQGVQHSEAKGLSSVSSSQAIKEETSVAENSSSAQASHARPLLPVPNGVHVSAIESPVILGPASGTTVNYNNPAHLTGRAENSSLAQNSHAHHPLPTKNDFHVSAIESPVILGPATGTTINYNNPAH